MKNKILFFAGVGLAALAFLLLPLTAVAQQSLGSPFNPPVAQVVDPAPTITDVKVGGIPVAAILSLAATVVVAGIKWLVDKLGTKIKPSLIPVVALVVSYGLDWVSSLTFGTGSNPWLALGAGLAAVGLNQFKKQLVPAAAG